MGGPQHVAHVARFQVCWTTGDERRRLGANYFRANSAGGGDVNRNGRRPGASGGGRPAPPRSIPFYYIIFYVSMLCRRIR